VDPKAPSRPQKLHLAAPPKRWPSLTPSNSLVIVLVLAVGVLAVYAPSLHYHFILDDHRFTGDPRVQNPGHVWEYFANYVWAQFTGGPQSFYRPLFVLWMRVNFILSAMSPWGWHLLSILKHVAVAILFYLLAWRLLRDHIAALLAATLFALHPAQTECVAWVTVPDPLMCIGIFITLLFYLRFAEEISASTQVKKVKKKAQKPADMSLIPRPALPWLLASAVVCFLTMLAKETAIILPVIIFVLTLFMLRGDPPTGTEKKGSADLLARCLVAIQLTLPFACAAVLYLFMRFNALGGKVGSLTQHLPLRTVLLSWPAILWFYVKALLWPVRSYAFGDSTLEENFSVRGVLLPALGVACVAIGLAALLFWLWKKARRDLPSAEANGIEYSLLIGILLLVFPILLALNLNVLNPDDFLHGRYVYLSSAGLMLIVATGWHFAGKARMPLLGIAGAVAIAFAVLTVSQEKQWSDDLTLFTVSHQLAPDNRWVERNLERANVQAALGLVEQGRCSEVLSVFERVTREYPEEWYAWAGLGYCYFTMNNLPKAEESLHRAAQLSRDPRTIQQWQALRAHMGLPTPAPLD
jgi:protein O-mannosyl-transferase